MLSIEDYSYIAIVGLIFIFPNLFINISIEKSMLKTPAITSTDYSTHLIFNVVLSLVVYLVIALTSSLLAVHFRAPQLGGMIVVMGLSLVFDAISQVYSIKLIRKNRVLLRGKIFIASSLLGSTVGLVALYLRFGFWSYILMVLSQSIIQCLLHLILVKLKIKFIFEFNILLNHLRTSFVGFLIFVNDGLLNSIYIYGISSMSTNNIASYSRGDSLSKMFSMNIASVIEKYYLTLYGKFTSKAELLHVYASMRTKLFLILIGVTSFMYFAAVPLFLVFFGEKWIFGVETFKYLVLGAFFIPNDKLFKTMIFSQLSMKLNLYIDTIKFALMLIPCFFLFYVSNYHFFLISLIVVRLIILILNNFVLLNIFRSRDFQELIAIILLSVNLFAIHTIDHQLMNYVVITNNIIKIFYFSALSGIFYFINKYLVSSFLNK